MLIPFAFFLAKDGRTLITDKELQYLGGGKRKKNTCSCALERLAGWNSSQRNGEDVQPAEVLGGMENVPAVSPVHRQDGGRAVFLQEHRVPLAICSIHLRDVPFHLPSNSSIRYVVHLPAFNLDRTQDGSFLNGVT